MEPKSGGGRRPRLIRWAHVVAAVQAALTVGVALDDEQYNESGVLLVNGCESRAVAERVSAETSLSSKPGACRDGRETLAVRALR
jgi:hypothetical protein